MSEDFSRQKVLLQLKNLIENDINNDTDFEQDLYCEFMKNMILRTYSEN